MGLFKFIKDAINEAEEEKKEFEEFKEKCSKEVNEYGFIEVKCDLSTEKKIDKFIAFDMETTGFDSINDRIIEVSALKFECGEIVDKFSSLINPKRHIPEEVTKITHITDQKVKYAPDTESVLWDFAKWIGDARTGETILVAHNADFDLKFLKHYFHLYDIPATMKYKDTLRMSRRLLPQLENHKLGTVAKHLGIKFENAHRAELDAEVCGRIFVELMRL